MTKGEQAKGIARLSERTVSGIGASLKVLRDRETGTAEFRGATRELCALLMRELQALLSERGVVKEPVLIIILRAAIAFLDSATRIFPDAPVGVFGIRRDPRTKRPHWYYENLPPISKKSVIVVLDPMLATGGSAKAAVSRLILRDADPKSIYFVGVIAAPEGLSRLARYIPRENIVLAATDKRLDAYGMIVPGLGDLGDRYFGYDDSPAFPERRTRKKN